MPILSHGTTAYYKSINGWSSIPRSVGKLVAAGSRSQPPSLADGISEVMIGDAGGDYGLTALWGNQVTCVITETDIVLDSSIVWETPDEAYANPLWGPGAGYNDVRRGYATMFHEFGHVVGFHHCPPSEFSMLQSFGEQNRRPLLGFDLDPTFGRPLKLHPMPEDAKGYRYLYPATGSALNVAASSARMHPATGNGVVSNTNMGRSNRFAEEVALPSRRPQ